VGQLERKQGSQYTKKCGLQSVGIDINQVIWEVLGNTIETSFDEAQNCQAESAAQDFRQRKGMP
jgi:hypothetical protein